MKLGTLALLLSTSVLLSGCAAFTRFEDDNAAGYSKFSHEECVPYARRLSNIEIYGDAHTWWQKAQGTYLRGQVPEVGAVLVLARTPRLPRGHLAVVTDYMNPREIMVTQTNWGSGYFSRRVTYERLKAQDISVENNWTKLRFWNHEHKAYGSAYPAYGFIYNRKAVFGDLPQIPKDGPPVPPQSQAQPTPAPAPAAVAPQPVVMPPVQAAPVIVPAPARMQPIVETTKSLRVMAPRAPSLPPVRPQQR